MKRIKILLMCMSVAVFALTGCGKNKNAEEVASIVAEMTGEELENASEEVEEVVELLDLDEEELDLEPEEIETEVYWMVSTFIEDFMVSDGMLEFSSSYDVLVTDTTEMSIGEVYELDQVAKNIEPIPVSQNCEWIITSIGEVTAMDHKWDEPTDSDSFIEGAYIGSDFATAMLCLVTENGILIRAYVIYS